MEIIQNISVSQNIQQKCLPFFIVHFRKSKNLIVKVFWGKMTFNLNTDLNLHPHSVSRTPHPLHWPLTSTNGSPFQNWSNLGRPMNIRNTELHRSQCVNKTARLRQEFPTVNCKGIVRWSYVKFITHHWQSVSKNTK